MNRNTYRSITDFGSNAYFPVNNPLTYCINNQVESKFAHGGQTHNISPNSKSCQNYMSEYCASEWDDFCEYASNNKDYQNIHQSSSFPFRSLNSGEILIRNTAAQKYLVEMINGEKKYEPFDPTVATSPMISYWVNSNHATMIPIYSVDPTKIDQDPVMDKIINNPIIAFEILVNIRNTMKNKGTLQQLKGTKLGNLYENLPYFKNKGGLS
jgi:hypothetical protein